MTHYSQYCEDEIISEFFGDYVGTFLDLGAGDGTLCSNTRALAERGWRGWLVEPEARAFLELRKLYADNHRIKLLNCALSYNGRPLCFYPHDGQLSTGVEALAQSAERYMIASVQPSELAPLIYSAFDFVSLDCEGMDQEIAGDAFGFLCKTRLFCYEHDLPNRPHDDSYSKRWASLIRYYGFTKVVGKTEGNTLVTRP